MALTITTVKQEIKQLKTERSEIERKITALEQWLGDSSTHTSNGGVSARGGADIRPAVKEVLTANGNAPMKVKDIVDAVAEKMSGMNREVIEKKMFHVKRTILEKTEVYGMYRLKAV